MSCLSGAGSGASGWLNVEETDRQSLLFSHLLHKRCFYILHSIPGSKSERHHLGMQVVSKDSTILEIFGNTDSLSHPISGRVIGIYTVEINATIENSSNDPLEFDLWVWRSLLFRALVE